jgi:putative flavoprotein involved in K+ transport
MAHSERWDSLAFQFPNWALRLPGFEYSGLNPDAFAHYREIATYVEDYARFAAPVRCGAEVTQLRQGPNCEFLIDTMNGGFKASKIVVATGPFQRPLLPACAAAFPSRLTRSLRAVTSTPTNCPPARFSSSAVALPAVKLQRNSIKAAHGLLSVSRHRLET